MSQNLEMLMLESLDVRKTIEKPKINIDPVMAHLSFLAKLALELPEEGKVETISIERTLEGEAAHEDYAGTGEAFDINDEIVVVLEEKCGDCPSLASPSRSPSYSIGSGYSSYSSYDSLCYSRQNSTRCLLGANCFSSQEGYLRRSPCSFSPPSSFNARIVEEAYEEHIQEGQTVDHMQKVFLGGLPQGITAVKLIIEIQRQGYDVLNEPIIHSRGYCKEIVLESVARAKALVKKGKILIAGKKVDVRAFRNM